MTDSSKNNIHFFTFYLLPFTFYLLPFLSMSIKIRYFASLKELTGRSEDELAFINISSVEDVWKQANKNNTVPDNTLAAVNMEYVSFDSLVKDGDEVAFFPPVTGG